MRGIADVKGLKGTEVSLVELSVSHYLLARALEMHGMKESELKVVNTSDSDIGPAFIANKSQKAVVTWNPMVMTIEQTPGVSKIFDSSKIPARSSTCSSSTPKCSTRMRVLRRPSWAPGTR